jgi:hypothetical protein
VFCAALVLGQRSLFAQGDHAMGFASRDRFD